MPAPVPSPPQDPAARAAQLKQVQASFEQLHRMAKQAGGRPSPAPAARPDPSPN